VSLGRTTLEVGTSPAWRTWATRRVQSRDRASGVEVRVLDPEGRVLHADRAAVADGAALPST
jgi:hypothetical protein